MKIRGILALLLSTAAVFSACSKQQSTAPYATPQSTPSPPPNTTPNTPQYQDNPTTTPAPPERSPNNPQPPGSTPPKD
jgi:hypothetical protein